MVKMVQSQISLSKIDKIANLQFETVCQTEIYTNLPGYLNLSKILNNFVYKKE